MAKLTDLKIKALIKAGERFSGVSDDDCPGLYLCWPDKYAKPFWRLRYKIGGKARAVNLGSYEVLGLADARKTAKELRAKVHLGHDPAGEKQERKAAALAKIEKAKLAKTVGDLADEYFEKRILEKWKHPNIVRSRIEKDIRPAMGNLNLEDVRPGHITGLLESIVDRGAPTIANDVLRWLRRMFDYGVKRHYLEINPAAAFDVSDAGGKEEARERALSLNEIAALFAAMKVTPGFSRQNDLTVRLLLMLGVRKMELVGARWAEFDLDAGVWNLPAIRTKTEKAVTIPLPAQTVEHLRELHRMACGSSYVFPARKAQERMLPHIHENTINVALSKVKRLLADMEPFTVHDFRRTVRTGLAGLNIPPHICERCLNHKIKGVEGIYDRYDYFDERKEALNTWAAVLAGLEDERKVVPIRGKK
jgi:integrase